MKLSLVAMSIISLSLAGACGGCGKKKETAPPPAGAATPTPATPVSAAPGHGGAVIGLGSATIGAFDVKATRDQGSISPGKDAPIDVVVTPASGQTAEVAAVRFWIGTQDAKGSVKARAEVEDPSEPNRWHTHAEIPSPLPTGAKLWVEIEDDKGATSVGSFELND